MDREVWRGRGGSHLGGRPRADRGRAPDPVVQLLRRVEPARRVTTGGEAAEALGTLGRGEAARSAAFLREALPGPLRPAFGEAFIRYMAQLTGKPKPRLCYLPTASAWEHGGYEVETVSPFTPEAAKDLTELVAGYLQGEMRSKHASDGNK